MSVPLSQVAEVNPKAEIPIHFGRDKMLDFLPMADVSETGSISVSRQRPLSEVQKGFTAFHRGDILIAKITPCFENNKIAIANISSDVGFGSTEFHVVRCNQSRLDSRYLLHLLRSNDVRSEGRKRMTGSAGQQRVPKQFLEELQIPLPPLDEQKRIAAILDQADDLRRKRQRAIDRLNQLGQAIFNEMFGGDSGKSNNFNSSPLGQLCDLVRGGSPRPQGDPRFFGGRIPRLMIADITRDGMHVTPRIDSLTEEGAKKSRPMKAGSIVMAVSGAVGLPAILAVDACIHDGFVGFRNLREDILPDFFYWYLVVNREVNRAQGTGAIWVNLTTDQVKRFSVPMPPLELQKKFALQMTALSNQSAQLDTARRTADLLFNSLQHRAFRGEL
jgi:type I restriction enzyme, S subunit